MDLLPRNILVLRQELDQVCMQSHGALSSRHNGQLDCASDVPTHGLVHVRRSESGRDPRRMLIKLRKKPIVSGLPKISYH